MDSASKNNRLLKLVPKSSTNGASLTELQIHDLRGVLTEMKSISAYLRLDPEFRREILLQRLEHNKDRLATALGKINDSSSQDQALEVVYHESKSKIELLGSFSEKLADSHQLHHDETFIKLKRIVSELQENQDKFEKLVYSSGVDSSDPAEASSILDIAETVIIHAKNRSKNTARINLDSRLKQCTFVPGGAAFQEILQVLVNNSVDAAKQGDDLTVTLQLERTKDDFAVVTITDNGKGMTNEQLGQLGTYRATHGKRNGRGIGVYSALKNINTLVGKIEVSSRLGKGTSFTVTVPAVSTPRWSADKILLPCDATVLILDAEASIHELWRSHLEAKFKRIKIVSFLNEEDLRSYLKHPTTPIDLTYLILDYQLEKNRDPLQLLLDFELASRTTLATSHMYSTDLRNRCVELGVQLIAKKKLVQLPLENFSRNPDFVLLENSRTYTERWIEAAIKHKQKGLFFSSDLDLLRVVSSIKLDTPIVLDEELEHVKGSDVARRLHQQGFRNIFLSTNHRPEKFADMSFTTILDKDPTAGTFKKLTKGRSNPK